MKKYKVTYEMRYYGSGGVIGQYTTEFSAEEEYCYNVAIVLCPINTTHLRWMIDSVEEVI